MKPELIALLAELHGGCPQTPGRWSGDSGECSRVDEAATDALLSRAAAEIEQMCHAIESLLACHEALSRWGPDTIILRTANAPEVAPPPVPSSSVLGEYDSRADTQAHIERVNALLRDCVQRLALRGRVHDQSKLHEPEKSIFDACALRLKTLVYGSDEYKQALAELKPALDHHYAENSHHPEHYENGVDGMSLLDLVEMLVDWKAATERMQNGGDIRRSLEINCGRFKLAPQLVSILANTIRELGW